MRLFGTLPPLGTILTAEIPTLPAERMIVTALHPDSYVTLVRVR